MAEHQIELRFRKQASSKQALKGETVRTAAKGLSRPPDCCGIDKSDLYLVPCCPRGENLIVNTCSILQSDNPMLRFQQPFFMQDTI